MPTMRIYPIPRALSVFISLTVFLFFSELTLPVTTTKTIFAIIAGILYVIAIILLVIGKKQARLLSLLPVAYWVYIVTLYLQGGLIKSINIPQFIFVSICAGLVTYLGYYAWRTRIGGLFYLALAMFYMFMSFGRIGFFPMLIVITVLILTGIMFYFTTPGAPKNAVTTDGKDATKTSAAPSPEPIVVAATDTTQVEAPVSPILNVRVARVAKPKNWSDAAKTTGPATDSTSDLPNA